MPMHRETASLEAGVAVSETDSAVCHRFSSYGGTVTRTNHSTAIDAIDPTGASAGSRKGGLASRTTTGC
jgi:hypothetical protein